jgi:GTP-binding protein Era
MQPSWGQRVADEPERTTGFRSGQVAIVGRPNVGKSTLLNALVGERISITSRKAQTTRHRIAGILTTADTQYVFVDTPGFQTRQRSRLNERMNRTVTGSLADVEATILVMEAGTIQPADRAVIRLLPAGSRAVAVLNKVDRLADKNALLPQMAELATLQPFAAIVPVSAEQRTGLDRLLVEVRSLLPAGTPAYDPDALTDQDERFLAAEFVREKIFRLLGAEVPYASTVAVEKFEHEGELRRIFVTVYVDRENQRAILLGEGGATMKKIATQARADMERLFGGRVFLEVWVRVKRGWADDERMLQRLGH